MQPQVGMPGAGPVPLERGQGKADLCSIVCGVSLAQVSSAVPQLSAALLCPALGLCLGLFTGAQRCGSSSLAPRAQPIPRLAPSLFCTMLCSRALETRRAACPHRAGCACFPPLRVCLSLCLCRQAKLALLWSLSCSFAAWVLGSS